MTNDGTTGARADMIEFLTRQHREVEQLWTRLKDAHVAGSTVQAELGKDIVQRLSQHDALETQLLYPELRSAAGEQGVGLSDHSLDEHKQVRELLTHIDGRDPADDSVFATFTQCINAVMHHVQEEEQQIFPLLRQKCGEERLMELGGQMEAMMPVAPTHPHPHTPDSKLGAAVAGMAAGVIDKVRDAIQRK
jgi:hemerythrin superfamily protein